MSTKSHAASVEEVLREAGFDVVAAKVALAKLDQAFGGYVGDIPDGAMNRWVDEHFHAGRRFFIALGKTWERELAAGLLEDRQWERTPGAKKPKK